MGVFQTVKDLFETPGPQSPASQHAGSYWCDDCGVKILGTEVEGDTADCPECGDEMRYERSMKGINCC